MSDMLQVQGRMTLGYGIIPKMIMQDRRLTPEAKCIYSYFCSYAGAGATAFPSRDKIMYDLKISKDRYYKHFNLLKEFGYIDVSQNIDQNGSFKNNIYTIIEMISPCPENKDTDKTSAFSPCPCFPDTGNKDTNNNSIKSNTKLYKKSKSMSKSLEDMTMTLTNDFDIQNDSNTLTDKSQPESNIKNEDSHYPQITTDADYEHMEITVKEQINYDWLVEKANEGNIIDDVSEIDSFLYLIIEIMLSNKTSIRINGEDKSATIVKSVFQKIDGGSIIYSINKFKEQKHEIKHKKSYLLTCLYNSKIESPYNGFNYINRLSDTTKDT